MSIVEDFGKARILCVGDVMIDRFVSGTIKRISPESPVPVLSFDGEKTYPGGAANVARNIAALGGVCTLIGVVGRDAQGRGLAGDLETIGVQTAFVTCSNRVTTEKTRFVAHGQHVLRVDQECADPVSEETAAELVSQIADRIDDCDVLVLSDYAKGVLTDSVVREAIALARARNIPVVVDPKSKNFSRYSGATVITPNSGEVEAATNINPALSDPNAAAAGEVALAQAKSDAILITRAEKGMTLVRSGAQPVHIPGRAREVFDVVGAGDTAVAALSLVLAAGADLAEAARIANVAAGIAVGRRGTSTVSQSDLHQALTRSNGTFVEARKVVGITEIGELAKMWKQDSLRVGFTNGCFDILHLGHVELLRYSRRNCDRLVVGINSDDSVRRLKGPDRPLNREGDRSEVLAALDVVDAVVIFEDETPLSLIRHVEPDVLIKGADYALQDIVGADFVLARGGEVLRFELVPGRSSTRLVNQIRPDTPE